MSSYTMGKKRARPVFNKTPSAILARQEEAKRRRMQSTSGKAFLRANPQIVRYQQTHQGGEVKGFDVTNATTTTTNSNVAWVFNQTPKINCVNLITIGSSSWNRIGRKVSLKSFRLRGYLNATGFNVTGITPQYGRMTLIYDKQPNGALPVAADIFLDQSSVTADSSISSWTSGINLNNRDRFEVIMDKQWMMPEINTSTGVVGGGLTATVDNMHFDLYHKLGGRETHFKSDNTPAGIGDIATGSLIFVTQGNIASGSEPYDAFFSMRIRYTDL